MASSVVLASGNGTNFEAIAKRLADSPHRIEAVICDRDGAPVLDRARALEIETVMLDYSAGRTMAEKQLYEILLRLRPDYVFLAGFMRIVPSYIVDAFDHRIVNIHPALLPRYRGLNAIERAYSAGDTTIGITVHYVDAGVDTGEIIQQCSLQRGPNESLEEIECRIHELEHQLFPEVALRLLDSVSTSHLSGAIR